MSDENLTCQRTGDADDHNNVEHDIRQQHSYPWKTYQIRSKEGMQRDQGVDRYTFCTLEDVAN